MDTLRIVWEGWDGSRWDLLNPRSATFALSIEGLGMPAFTQQKTKIGSRDGSRYEGTTWEENSLVATIKVGDEYLAPGFSRRRRGEQWRALDRAFCRSFSPEHKGRLIVTSGVGDRWLNLRLDAPITPPAGSNPAEVGTATYVIGLTADDDPWWIGPDETASFDWSTDEGVFFQDPVPADEVGLYIAVDGALDQPGIPNPGDRPAWPQWWAQGFAEEVHFGIGDDFVVLPFRLAEGAKVYVDSYNQTIVDEVGTSLWPLMGFNDPSKFSPIPPGDLVSLHTRLLGGQPGAAIGLRLTPRYSKPW